MEIVIERLNDETMDLEPIGRIADGAIIEGQEELDGVVLEEDLQYPEEILERYNGPRLFARPEPHGVTKARDAYSNLQDAVANQSNERRLNRVEVSKLQTPDRSLTDRLEKADWDYIAVDDALMRAIETQIWEDDMTKAPVMWQDSGNVPRFVKEFIEEAIEEEQVLYDEFANVHNSAVNQVHGIIKKHLTGPTGWSINQIAMSIFGSFDEVTRENAETIARTEVAAVLNKARELAYEASDDVVGFYWSGPDDHRTTDLCEGVKADIEQRGGYVESLEVLKEILRKHAHRKADTYGTPGRVEDYVPHFKCRHTYIRAEYRFLD